VRRALSRDLSDPIKTLDATYERALQGIDEEKWAYAHRIFQCLTVAARPLRVEELAEIFAIQVDADVPGIPEFDVHWRHKNAEDIVLSACSSLITVIDSDSPEKGTVKFSHFSVQQFLTSDRIKNSKYLSDFHVLLEPAHTFFAKACLSILLQSDDGIDGSIRISPLASYAANHWAHHARCGNVSSTIVDGIGRLFDIDEPHSPDDSQKHDVVPLLYASLYGLDDMTKRLLDEQPENTGDLYTTLLHAASEQGHVKVARLLLAHGADVTSRDSQHRTPLFLASQKGRLKVVQVLLEHGADAACRDSVGWTPLHTSSAEGHDNVVLFLLEHGANRDSQDNDGSTPLHQASRHGRLAVVQSLLEWGADVDARDKKGSTALHFASYQGDLDVVRLLLDYGAKFLARDNNKRTFLEVASTQGRKEIAEVGTLYSEDGTALHIASQHGDLEAMRWLFEQGAVADVEDENQETPLFPASRNGQTDAVRLLLDKRAKADHRNWQETTPLHWASEKGHEKVSELLLSKGKAGVNAENKYKWSPLHFASRTGEVKVTRVLLREGANVNAQNDLGWTPLHMASQQGHVKVVDLLLTHKLDVVDAQKADGETALHLAAYYGHVDVVKALLAKGANPDIKNKALKRPEDMAQDEGREEVKRSFEVDATIKRFRGESVPESVGRQAEMIA
jgi:ankyrin repeat protein